MKLFTAIEILSNKSIFEYCDEDGISMDIKDWESVLENENEEVEFGISEDEELILLPNKTVVLSPNKDCLTEKASEKFMVGFCSVAETIDGYSFENDINSEYPWATPWNCSAFSLEDWYVSSLSAYEMGVKYAKSVEKEIAECISQWAKEIEYEGCEE